MSETDINKLKSVGAIRAPLPISSTLYRSTSKNIERMGFREGSQNKLSFVSPLCVHNMTLQIISKHVNEILIGKAFKWVKIMEWKPFCKRFVAFVDIAGFKAMVRDKDPMEIAAMLNEFKSLSEKQHGRYNGTDWLYTIAISDSIILISKDDSSESFACFCQSIGDIYNETTTFKLMNAAIAVGDMYVDKSRMVLFGKPYIKAYSLQEQMNYYGVLCDESVADYIQSRQQTSQKDYFHFYKKLFIQLPSSIKNKNDDGTNSVVIQNKLNFKWFDRHFDPFHRFADTDGIYVGTYYERMYSLLKIEKSKLKSRKEEISKIEDRIANTKKMIDFFIKKELYVDM